MNKKSLTIGLSPKVKWPAVALVALAVIVLALWVLATGGTDLAHPLFIIAMALLGAAGVQLPIGWASGPGEVVSHLNDDADPS